MTSALTDVLRDTPEVKTKIKEIILAAPDIDADVFKRDIAPTLVEHGPNITLYASSNDWALAASKAFHGYARAGDAGDEITIVSGITTIDSSEVQSDFLGHSYYADSPVLLSDIADVFNGRQQPQLRSHLSEVDSPLGTYWKLLKP